MSKPFGLIYKATNIINGKCYIGQTTDTLKKRINGHFKSKCDTGVYFHNALRKYGKKNFKWEVLCECENKDLLNIRETMKIIVEHSHKSEGNGYNLTWGGEGSYGYKHTSEIKKKMKGRKVTDEGRINMSNSKKGLFHSESHKINISKSCKGRKHTEEHKRKIGSKNKISNKVYPIEWEIKVIELRKTNMTLQDIANIFKISKSVVQQWCERYTKQTNEIIGKTYKKHNP